MRSDFWPIVGVTALVLLLTGAASSVGSVSGKASSTEVSAWVLGVLLWGPLIWGLYLYFLKRIRGERVRAEIAFAGFSTSLLQLVLAGLVSDILELVGLAFCLLPGIYLSVAWLFTLPLVIDKRLDFWPAMRLSLKAINPHWWKFLGLHLVLALLNLGGLMLCFVGVFITLPVTFAALMYAYEDVFNPPKLPSTPPALSRAPGAESRAQPGVVALPHDLRSWATVILAGLLAVSLLVGAGLACLTGTIAGACVAVAAGALALAILLRGRKSSVPHGFLAPFLVVFLLVFGAATLITHLIPESFVSTTRIRLIPNTAEATRTPDSPSASGTFDPYTIQTECEVMQSEEILGPVITALDLDRKWGKRHRREEPLERAETLDMLKSRMHLRPVRNTFLIAICIHSRHPEEAAQIANEIAQTYKNHNADRPFSVEIVDRASPARRPSHPNTPLNLALGVLFGLVLGTAAGVAGVAFSARKTRG